MFKKVKVSFTRDSLRFALVLIISYLVHLISFKGFPDEPELVEPVPV